MQQASYKQSIYIGLQQGEQRMIPDVNLDRHVMRVMIVSQEGATSSVQGSPATSAELDQEYGSKPATEPSFANTSSLASTH